MQQVLFFRLNAQQSSSLVRVPQTAPAVAALSAKQRLGNGSDHGFKRF